VCCRIINVQVRQYKPKHFVFVHGMGGGAWFWFEIQTLLQRIGFNSTAVDLTSHGINKAIADNLTTVAEYRKPLLNAIAGIHGEVQ
jgi:triacylglycerol esterase/lipase EstA (alpha/beta hydrolase family)